jgi:hypothetical protein
MRCCQINNKGHLCSKNFAVSAHLNHSVCQALCLEKPIQIDWYGYCFS